MYNFVVIRCLVAIMVAVWIGVMAGPIEAAPFSSSNFCSAPQSRKMVKTRTVPPRGNAPGATPADFASVREYDPAGRVTAVRSPEHLATETSYDLLGRVIASTRVHDDGAMRTVLSHSVSDYDDVAGTVQQTTFPGEGLSETLCKQGRCSPARISGQSAVKLLQNDA